MKIFNLVLLGSTMGLSACALITSQEKPVAHRINVSGKAYLLEQITDSTWTASAQAEPKLLAATSAATAALRRAIEETSGCKVTDSDYSRNGAQFDAQVDCGKPSP